MNFNLKSLINFGFLNIKCILSKIIFINFIYRRIILISMDIFLILFSVYLGNYLIGEKLVFDSLIFYLITIGIPIYLFTGQYKGITRYFDNTSITKIVTRNTVLYLILSLNLVPYQGEALTKNKIILLWLITNLVLVISRIYIKEIISRLIFSNKGKSKVAIYGAGQAGAQLAASINFGSKYTIKFFIDDDPNLWKRKIFNLPIYPPEKIKIYKNQIDTILFAIPTCGRKRRLEIFNNLRRQSIKLLQVPSIEKLENGAERIDTLRPIAIEEILSREIIMPNFGLISACISNQPVFVTGAGGSIGKELCMQIIKFNPSKLLILENNEHNLYKIKKQINKEFGNNISLETFLGDVKDSKLLKEILNKHKVKTVFHTAAYKHVSLVEENPIEGISNNVFSTKEICQASYESDVESFILISSDKAVRPKNLMGATKRLSELIVQAYNIKVNNLEKSLSNDKKRFSIVRFGNVLGSSGSVVPLFKKQIKDGGPITVTHPDVVRYFMTIEEAVQLVLQAANMCNGGEVFLLDMGKPVNILELAKQMIRLSGLQLKDKKNVDGDIEIVFTGLANGEKLYEELLIDSNSQPTDHPLIFKAEEKSIEPKLLWQKLDELDINVRNKKVKKSIQIISDLLPEWEKSQYIKNLESNIN